MFAFRNFFRAIQSALRKFVSPVITPPPQPLTETFNNNREPGKRLNVRWADHPNHGEAFGFGSDSSARLGHANIVVLIFIRYSGRQSPQGQSMQLQSTKNDLSHILRHLKYHHTDETRRFFIMTDFQVEYADSSGTTNIIPTMLPTRHNIETLILGIMRDLQRHDKCLFYYGGHVELDRSLTDRSTNQYMLLASEERIYGHEFRRWLSQAKYASTIIVVTIDASHSGGFLGLEYSDGISKQTLAAADDKITSLLIEISAAQKGQSALTRRSNDRLANYGALTRFLVDFLELKPDILLPDLGDYLRRKFDDAPSPQVPQISSSRRIEGSITLF